MNQETGRYRSGQTGRTVNPLAYAFSGSNPLLPIFHTNDPYRSIRLSQLLRNPDRLDHHTLGGKVIAVCRNTTDGIQHLQPLGDMAEDGVLAV